MATYIEYQLSCGDTILVEAEEGEAGGLVKVSRDGAGNVIATASRSFEESLAGVQRATEALYGQLKGLSMDEIAVTFGLKVVGEVGLFAIGKAGAEANYQVTLKWANPKS